MYQLVADALFNDPDFQSSKKKILETVEKYRKKITHVRAAESALKLSYEQTLLQIKEYRSLALFYPYLGSGFGNGALVELADGSVKYDFISGIGTHFGHSHPKLIAASIDASIQDIVMQGNLQQNQDSVELMKLLVENSGLPHCFLCTSGAIANENALKIIFQKKSPAHRILAFEKCFIGRTLSLSQITDRPSFRQGLPHNLHIDYLPFYDEADPKGSTQRTINALHACLKRYPKAYACMCIELIQGEAGYYPGSRDYFLTLIEVLKQHAIAIFVDEVQTFGRTDSLFAFQHFGLAEHVDVVTCGKLMHTCATLFKEELAPQPGLLSQTYTSATSSIHVASAIIKSLVEEGYLGAEGKNMRLRRKIVNGLHKLCEKYPDKIEGPFGYGLMIAFTPFKGDQKQVIAFTKKLFEEGVLSFMAGENPTRVRFLVPAGAVTDEDIDQVMNILDTTLRTM